MNPAEICKSQNYSKFTNFILEYAKVIILGDSGVGKTAIIEKYCTGNFD